MQISGTSTTSAASDAQQVLAMLMQAQQTSAGQQMPSDATEASAVQPTAPAPGGAQLADSTLSGLIDAQQSQSSSADGASRPHHHGHHRHGGATSGAGAAAQPASPTTADSATATQATSISV
jgi:hypothetical protein